MNKLQISGTYLSFSIIELNEADAFYLRNIMEKELITYHKIFFDRKAYKKLGYKTLDALPVILQINGFLSSNSSLQYPDGFTYFKNKKKVFVSTLERLEGKYHSGLYKEYSLVKSSFNTSVFSFKKKKGCKYFLMKKQQIGRFSLALKDDIQLNELLFEHKFHHFKIAGSYEHSNKLLEIYLDDSKLGFSVGAQSEIKRTIIALN
jgi:hypothetical protein